MSKFKVGDVVKRRDGNKFSNKELTATVGVWVFDFEPDGKVALVETGTYTEEKNIELVSSSPVRETLIVKKEIIPGTYGRLCILNGNSKYVTIGFGGDSMLDKTELEEAIKTLQTIHDAME